MPYNTMKFISKVQEAKRLMGLKSIKVVSNMLTPTVAECSSLLEIEANINLMV